MNPAATPPPEPSTVQVDGDALAALIQLATEFLQRQQQPPQPRPERDTGEDVDTGDTTFRYRLLTSLMSAKPIGGLVAHVVRDDRGGLLLSRPPTLVRGTHLSFDASGRTVQLPLTDDRLLASDLSSNGVDVREAIEALVLRDGHDGPAVAVAPPLPPVVSNPA